MQEKQNYIGNKIQEQTRQVTRFNFSITIITTKTNNMEEQNSAAAKSSSSPAKKIIILVTLVAREHNNLLRSPSILSNQMNMNGSKANGLQLNKAEQTIKAT